MKNLTASILFIVITSSHLLAQTSEPVIKLLPHHEEDMVRLMYVGSPDTNVKVTFKQNDKIIKTDIIRASRFKNGFIKLYDVAHLKDGRYTVEIEADGHVASCPFVVAEHEQLWAQFWNEQLNSNMGIVGIQKTDSIIKTAEN